jgi:hypothetical protein
MDWAQLVGTAGLFVVTLWYAVTTKRMADTADRAATSSEKATAAARDAAEAAREAASVAQAQVRPAFIAHLGRFRRDGDRGAFAYGVALTSTGDSVVVTGASVSGAWTARQAKTALPPELTSLPLEPWGDRATPTRLHAGERTSFAHPLLSRGFKPESANRWQEVFVTISYVYVEGGKAGGEVTVRAAWMPNPVARAARRQGSVLVVVGVGIPVAVRAMRKRRRS